MVDRRAVVVARRAAELAAAAGVALPDLSLWTLAGGRPTVTARRGEPDELGDLLEASTGAEARRRQGAHFTPRWLADELAARALDGCDLSTSTVGDPACGGGALLLAAARRLASTSTDRASVVTRLWGADLDPVAVATTEAALALWARAAPPAGRAVVADALVDDLGWPALDAVVGNPPFLTPLATATARSQARREALRTRYGDAVLPYTDEAALFLVAAIGLARPGANVALVQPRSVLSARDAAGVRSSVDRLGALRDVWVPEGRAFAADVDVCVPVIEVGGAGGDRRWGAHLARALGVPPVSLAAGPVLGDIATVVAAFRSEYYGTVPHVHEEADLPRGRPLVTAGVVDLGGIRWGEAPCRVGRRRWLRPVVDVGALEGRAAEWLARTAGPKLIVAPQTKVVEVAVDEEGRFVAAVPLVVVRPEPARLWHAAAALAAPGVSAWLLQRAAGSGRSPQAVRTSAPLLREVPLPPDGDAWDAGARAFRQRDLDGFARAMAVAYGIDASVTDWWLDRARTVWSPAPARR